MFEKLKQKKFSPSQRVVKLKILNKIVSLHNIKGLHDEAFTWAIKALESLDANDPKNLIIEMLNQSAEAFINKKLFEKAKTMTERSLTLSAKTNGEGSRAYAKSLIAAAIYLSETDQRQKSNDLFEKALKIFSEEDGERSVPAATIMGLMANNNLFIQAYSTQDYTVASEQAETAMQVIEEKLGKKNFLIVQPKNTMANIMMDKAQAIPEERSKLLSEAEKLGVDCLAILIATLGNYNSFTSGVMTGMGVTYRDSGRNSEAEELLTKSLAIKEKIMGEDLEVSLGHHHLAFLYHVNLNQLEKAEHHFKESIRITEMVSGPAFSYLGVKYESLANVYEEAGEIEKKREQRKKKEDWKKLQEMKGNKKDNKEKEEMIMEDLIKFVTDSEQDSPVVKNPL